MRLAVVTPVFPSDLDQPSRGVGIGAVVLIRALKALRPDLEVHVVHHRAGSTDPVRVLGPPEVHLYRSRGSRLARAALPVAPTQAEVARVLERIRPDVVHVRGAASFVDGQRWPAVLSVHGVTEREVRMSGVRGARIRSVFHALREPGARRRYRHVIAIAGYVARELEDQIQGRIHFIPNTVNTAFFDAANDRRDTDPVIVQAGDLGPIKNPAATVRAVGILARRGIACRLRLLGLRTHDDYCRALDRLVVDEGVADRVDMPGRVGRDRMPVELQRARVLALPSFVEVAPLAIIEASAVGVPSVVSAAGGSAEMVIDRYTGRVVNPRSPESIADGLQPYLESADLAALHGERARVIAERHRPEAVARDTLAVYEQVMAGFSG